MIELLEWLAAASFGGFLAVFYFGGLWWTVRQMPTARHPVAMYFGSLVSRLSVALAVLGVVAVSCPWHTLVACLLGFMIARLALIQLLGNDDASRLATERVRR